MNNTQPGPKSGLLSTEFYTMLLGNLISFLLMTGKITPDQAQALNGQTALIGGILLAVVSTGSYILTRFGLKLPWAQALAGQVNATPSPASAPDSTVPDAGATLPAPVVTMNGTPSINPATVIQTPVPSTSVSMSGTTVSAI